MYLDLTQELDENLPVYPGTPKIKIEPFSQVSKDGFRETTLTLLSHMGTHMDAPFHMVEEGKRLEEYGIEEFIGSGIVLDVRAFQGKTISLSHVQSQLEDVERHDFALLYTGRSAYFYEECYFEDPPLLEEDAAEFLSGWVKKGIGVDALTVDTMKNMDFVVHRKFMEKGKLIVENLKDLETLLGEEFEFYCIPIKFHLSDGAPARAFVKY